MKKAAPCPHGKMEMSISVKASDGGSLGEDIQYDGIMVLNASVTIPRMKIKICEYHLKLLKSNLNNEMAVRTYLEIIFKFLRSSTFTLQKICKHQEGFEAWWKKKQEEMKDDKILSKIVDLRNIAEKEGFDLTQFGVKVITRISRNGKRTDSTEPNNIIINNYTFVNVVDEMAYSIKKIKEIIEEAHRLGFIKENKNPSKYFWEIYREDDRGNWYRCNVKK